MFTAVSYIFRTQTSTTVSTIHVVITDRALTVSTTSLATALWALLEITVRLVG